MKRALAGAALAAWCAAAPGVELAVGSKVFTEGVILGEVLTQLVRADGIAARHRRELGGTRIVWEALRAGQIDAYAEYTGTLREEIFAGQAPDDAVLAGALLDRGVVLGPALGFANTYALAMPASAARLLGVARVSDLATHPALRVGLSHEFHDRADGWPGLRRAYGLPQRPRVLDHDLAYRALAAGSLDVVDVYTTDAEIPYYDLAVLADDRAYFPRYDAVIVYRADMPAGARAAFARLAGRLDATTMARMNRAVKLDGRAEADVAAEFLRTAGLIDGAAPAPPAASPWRGELVRRSAEHLRLTGISLALALVIGLPVGVGAAQSRRLGQAVLATAGVVQTVPALALFVFMIPLLGIGPAPAIAALVAYSLLPIVRATHAGLTGIAPELGESAAALGLSRGARLRLVELPLAAPVILSGIKTAAVINVGTATLGGLIGAGGYGAPIMTGIRVDDAGLILSGAVPAALLALAVQGGFDALERWLARR